MNYYTANGIVGSYQDVDVYVIDEEEFTEEKNVPYRIYAVRGERYGELTLVLRGNIIGTMDQDGLVKRMRTPKPYQFKPKKKKPVVRENKPEVSEVSVESEDINFSDYTKEVDKFFEGLNELWKEMEV